MSFDDDAFDRWEHAGLECMVRASGIGFFNGYVRLPESHPLHGADYNRLNRAIQVHGGLTYGSNDEGWIGFDTGHSGDRWPSVPSKYAMPPTEWDRDWTLTLLREETNSLASQLSTLTELPDPESAYDCTSEEFDALLRDAKAWRALTVRKESA